MICIGLQYLEVVSEFRGEELICNVGVSHFAEYLYHGFKKEKEI